MSSELKPISLESMMNESSSNSPSLKPDTLLKDIFAPYDVGEAQSQYSEDDVSAISHEVSKINSALSIEDVIEQPKREVIERDISEWYTEREISTPLIFECVKTQNVQITKPRCCKKLIVRDYDDNTANGLLLEITDFGQKTLSVSAGTRLVFYGEPWSEDDLNNATLVANTFTESYGSKNYPLVSVNNAISSTNFMAAFYGPAAQYEATAKSGQSSLKKLVSGGYDAFKVYGNIASLIDGENFSTIRSLDKRMAYAFAYIFCPRTYSDSEAFTNLFGLTGSVSASGNSSKNVYICATDYSGVVVPFSGELPDCAFSYMFANGSVITPPRVLGGYGRYAYQYAFKNSGITHLPNGTMLELKNTMVGLSQYYYMFAGCQMLNYIPKIICIMDASSEYKEQNVAANVSTVQLPANPSPFDYWFVYNVSTPYIKSYWNMYKNGGIDEIFDCSFIADIKIDMVGRISPFFNLRSIISVDALRCAISAPNGARYSISLSADEIYFKNVTTKVPMSDTSPAKPLLYIGPDSTSEVFTLSKNSSFNMDISIRNVVTTDDGAVRTLGLLSRDSSAGSSSGSPVACNSTTLIPCIWPNAAVANENAASYYYYDNVSIKVNLPKDPVKAAIAKFLIGGYLLNDATTSPGSGGNIGINSIRYLGYKSNNDSYSIHSVASVDANSKDYKVLIGPAQDMGPTAQGTLRDLNASYFADIDPVEINFIY